MKCSKCGAVNPEGAGYCGLCGGKIRGEAPKPVAHTASAVISCPECGGEMPARAAFCGKCGARLSVVQSNKGAAEAVPEKAPGKEKKPVKASAPLTGKAAGPGAKGSLREMVSIPEGWFVMGAPSETGNDDERPQHQVRLGAYYIDVCTVSNRDYERFAPNHRRLRPENSIGDDDPVVFVTYAQCMEYCAWRTEQEKLPPGAYTLPTEAQWECAARGGLDGKVYPWGDGEADFEYVNTLDAGRGRAMPVNKGKPNGFGLRYMGSNVREWCLDWYHPTWYSNIEATSPDTEGPRPLLLVNMRVVRGASFLDPVRELGRCSSRHYAHPESAGSDTGFRCVRRIS